MMGITAEALSCLARAPAYERLLLRLAFEGKTDTKLVFATQAECEDAKRDLDAKGFQTFYEGFTELWVEW